MKIGIITVAFNEKNLIVPCIRQFDGFNFPHIVLVSSKPWRGDYAMDETWALAQGALENGYVRTDHWDNQADQINYGLQILEDEGFDWALIVDADEFYTPKAIGELIGDIKKCKTEAITAPFMQAYWKTPDYRLFPDQEDNPIIAIKTDQRFIEKRHSDVNKTPTSVLMHHMSYVRTDEEMKKKIETFEHSHEFDLQAWYDNIWIGWNPEKTNLHPVIPNKWEKAIYNPAPWSIRRLLIKS